MSAMKDFLLDIQELVVDAMQAGATTQNDLFAYVQMYEPRATEECVIYATEQIFAELVENNA